MFARSLARDDVDRSGYGSVAPDGPDRLEYLVAKEAFEAYRAR
jgi:hypothetical protein